MQHQPATMGWGRFAAMILTSTAIMVVLMYQLVYSADHLEFSINRLVASLAMGCVMAIVMLGFMWSMYPGSAAKLAVVALAAIAAAALIYANRAQALIGDTAFMRAMIPHHSIAINNASKASLSDPRVRALADRIIASQVREIVEMQLLIDDIAQNGERGAEPLSAQPARVTPDIREQAGRVLR